jgi:hypothetical protein
MYVCMYVCIYIYIYVCVCVYICIYTPLATVCGRFLRRHQALSCATSDITGMLMVSCAIQEVPLFTHMLQGCKHGMCHKDR